LILSSVTCDSLVVLEDAAVIDAAVKLLLHETTCPVVDGEVDESNFDYDIESGTNVQPVVD